jgi:hypothetical protein
LACDSVEEYGFANAPKTDGDKALGVPASAQPFDGDPRLLQQRSPSGEFWRLGSGAGSVGIPNWVHV